jgi:two-component system, OmpR family, sensor kinase
VIGNLDLLKRGAIDDGAMRAEALRAIGDETERMSRLVSDLLLLAQADAGMELQRQPVEMDTFLLEVYRQAQMMAQGISVKLGGEDQVMEARE